MTRFVRRLPALLSLAALATACSGDGAGPTARSQVTFNLAAGVGGAGALRSFLSDTLTDPSNTLVLDTVQLVLRDIRFKRTDDDACDNDDQDDNGSDTLIIAASHDDGNQNDNDDGDEHDGEGDDGHADGCEFFNAGPFLLDLPLDTSITKAFSLAVDTGTYDELRIKVHKPEDDNGDPKDIQFLAAHPEFAKVSIRAVGSFNGTPFVFTSDVNAEERMDLVPPLVVADSATNVDVTIRVELANWFRDSGGTLVDPASANKGGANDNLVKQNILDSFHAFRDDDRDGEDEPGDD